MRAAALLAVALLARSAAAGLTCAETKWGENGKQETPLKTHQGVADNVACADLCAAEPGCTNYKVRESGARVCGGASQGKTMRSNQNIKLDHLFPSVLPRRPRHVQRVHRALHARRARPQDRGVPAGQGQGAARGQRRQVRGEREREEEEGGLGGGEA